MLPANLPAATLDKAAMALCQLAGCDPATHFNTARRMVVDKPWLPRCEEALRAATNLGETA